VFGYYQIYDSNETKFVQWPALSLQFEAKISHFSKWSSYFLVQHAIFGLFSHYINAAFPSRKSDWHVQPKLGRDHPIILLFFHLILSGFGRC
jgi:hypothetical protein